MTDVTAPVQACKESPLHPCLTVDWELTLTFAFTLSGVPRAERSLLVLLGRLIRFFLQGNQNEKERGVCGFPICHRSFGYRSAVLPAIVSLSHGIYRRIHGSDLDPNDSIPVLFEAANRTLRVMRA